MNELASLLPQLLQAPSIADVRSQMMAPGSGTVVVPAGLRPALIGLSPSDEVPTVVVTANGRRAEALAQAVNCWGRRATVFPAWETLPHERLSPGLDTMSRRAAVLRRLAKPDQSISDGGRLDVLVVPVRALLQPVVHSLTTVDPVRVVQGDWIDRDDLVRRLSAIGYLATDTVRGRGEVAVHGGIVDVFPPSAEHPVRIELFGDEVEDIRTFNLADQRSIAQTPEGLWAPPARELLLTEQVKNKARELQPQLPGVADLLELASEGIYGPGIESLAPVLVGNMVPLSTLIPEGALWLIDEPERVKLRAEDVASTAKEFEMAAWNAASTGGAAPIGGSISAKFAMAGLIDLEELWEPAGARWWELTELPSAQLMEQTSAGRHLQIDARDVVPYRGDLAAAAVDLRNLASQGWTLVLTANGSGSAKRMVQVLSDAQTPARFEEDLPTELTHGIIHVVPADAGEGFVLTGQQLAVFTEHDLTGGKKGGSTRDMRRMPARRKGRLDPLTLTPGDFIVHEQHGIGRFLQMESREVPGSTGKRDYLLIEYAGARGRPADQLYVPTSSLDQVSKYTGSDQPRLSRMGGSDWANTKKKAKAAVKEIAAELVRLYAARQATGGHAFSPDTPWQRELEDSFPFVETPDQLLTIDEVKADMERDVPMDRLLTGDVGYGKTEIAVRAAFKAIQDGKQVAILVPTTLLVQQHIETFTERFAGFPINIGSLSRFSTKAEAEAVREGLRAGTIDLVIGTHSLLTGAVRFKDLGLVVIDEEQRFGVEHKETLKALRASVDVLAMSATPIPRTLEMAVAGIREMSVLQTPPEERQPVLTFVGPRQNGQVAAAIRRELMRDGQVFYIHNRVESINKAAAELQELVPEARIRVAHGKLSEHELERVIVDFWNHEFDVLVCTTIVETGLDISNANTLIVERADTFGLSQLHQLRGRVGRGRERAYAYFFYPDGKTLTETALERLRTIASNNNLGAGLAVAQKDLELRGAGNLLGGAQSGHIEGVGFDLYVRMVSDAVAEHKGQKVKENVETRIELPVDAHLPDDYIPGEEARLEVYSKIAHVTDPAIMREVRSELEDRYGPMPEPVERLFGLARLRAMLRQLDIAEVGTQGKYVRLGPVELADSQALRLKRLYPGSVIKTATRQILVPAGKELPRDQEMLTWIESLLRTVVATRARTSTGAKSK